MRISEEIEDPLSYNEIYESCQGDPLQIAEYLYLRSDQTIGPLRHRLSMELQTDVSPLNSTPHVELVNLGASQIYTTNFDDIIERTFRELDLPVQVVALPKHVALADVSKPQVVKFHGDLRHEATLVLTESSYYKRLDFESPMDLKFRSDLLGRSVLFMGYSFRDVNIRVIWFKLMQIMKDIPAEDRPTSYIVRLTPNPVLETLYKSVGLDSIVLDSTGQATSREEQTQLLGKFLLDLAVSAAPDARIPGLGSAMFASPGLLSEVETTLETESAVLPPSVRSARGRDPFLEHLVRRTVPSILKEDVLRLSSRLYRAPIPSLAGPSLALSLARQFGPSPDVTLGISHGLLLEVTRTHLLGVIDVPWAVLWGSRIGEEEARRLVRRVRQEVVWHIEEGPDEDLAYGVDVLRRITSGEILDPTQHEVIKEADEILGEAGDIYASVSEYQPVPGEKPNPQPILQEIQERMEAESEAEGGTDHDEG